MSENEARDFSEVPTSGWRLKALLRTSLAVLPMFGHLESRCGKFYRGGKERKVLFFFLANFLSRLPFEDKTIYVVKEEVVTKKLRLPLPSKWPELWRNLLTACWRTDPSLRPDMATIGGWLHQMEIDYDKDPEVSLKECESSVFQTRVEQADGYKVLPACTAEELNIRLPESRSSHAASAPPVAEKLAALSLGPEGPSSLNSSAAPPGAPETAPVAAASGAAPSSSASSAPAAASGSFGSAPSSSPSSSSAAPAVASSAASSSSSLTKTSSGPLAPETKHSAPQSPSMKHRSAKGGIFESVARANAVDVVDTRPDAAFSPVPDRRN